MLKTHFFACAVIVTVSACGTTGEQVVEAPKAVNTCPEPRPEVCTQHYDPVCATLPGGATKTFSNACHACADSTVDGYRVGVCEAD